MFHPCKGPVAASTGYVLQPVPGNRLMISNRGKDRSGKRAQTGILPLTFAPARIVSARWPGKELGFWVSGTERRSRAILPLWAYRTGSTERTVAAAPRLRQKLGQDSRMLSRPASTVVHSIHLNAETCLSSIWRCRLSDTFPSRPLHCHRAPLRIQSV